MKVLMINVVCGISSTGRICTDLADLLVQNGHQVKIAYGRGIVPTAYEKYAVRIGNDIDVKAHVLYARCFDKAGFGSKLATMRFIKWVKEYDPDIIHLHNIHGYYINISILFSYLRSCGKRIIWTLHDCWAFTGHTAYCDAVDCTKWVDGCDECPLIKGYPSSIIDGSRRNWNRKKELFTNIPNMTVITPSKWLATWTKKSFLNGYDIEVVNNGINTAIFKPTHSSFRNDYHIEDKFVVLGVATDWDDMKGFSDFIRLSKVLDNQYQVVLVGLTDKQLKEIPDSILGIKRTNSLQELAQIYTAADLFVNLTYCDNYPTVNVQAMACGTPVLSYKTGGSTEIVEKYGGVIISSKNVEDVKCAIERVKEQTVNMLFIPSENDNSVAIRKYAALYK